MMLLLTMLLTAASALEGPVDSRDQWAFGVGLEVSDAEDSWRCRGVIIDARTVATAATCLREGRTVTVMVGSELASAERLPATEIVVHPEHDPSTLQADLALVRVDAVLDPIAGIDWYQALESEDPIGAVVVSYYAGERIYSDWLEVAPAASPPWTGVLRSSGEAFCPSDAGAPVFVLNRRGAALGGVVSAPTSERCQEREPRIEPLVAHLDWLEEQGVDWHAGFGNLPRVSCTEEPEEALEPPYTLSCTAEFGREDTLTGLRWLWNGVEADEGETDVRHTFEEEGRTDASICWTERDRDQACERLVGTVLCSDSGLEITPEPVGGLAWRLPVDLDETPSACLQAISIDLARPGQDGVRLVDQPFRHTFAEPGTWIATVRTYVGQEVRHEHVQELTITAEPLPEPEPSGGCSTIGLAGLSWLALPVLVLLRRRRRC